MGELFRRHQPKTALDWTGERLVTGVDGAIENEHLHRYFLARELCRGKDVLDVGSGEGYGAALLAQTAQRVIGVDVDPVSVEHSSHSYQSPNLSYIQGEAANLPLDDRSVDVVVSFETLEHFSNHEVFLAEVQRVLRPNGFLVISTPDKNVYSCTGSAPNPFHVRELTKEEFSDELHTAFCNVSLFRQRFIIGSAILPDAADSATNQTWVYDQRDANTFEGHRDLPRAPYLLAVASNAAMSPLGASLYFQKPEVKPEVQAELERLRAVEAASHEQAPIFAKAISDAASAREEGVKLAAAMSLQEAELERLRGVEAASREQAQVLARMIDVLAVREEAAMKRDAMLTKERNEAREDTETLREQFKAASLLPRQQTLMLGRLRQDLSLSLQRFQKLEQAHGGVLLEIQAAREEAARYKLAYNDVSGLLIPLWMRKSLPPALKRPLRALKRAMRPRPLDSR